MTLFLHLNTLFAYVNISVADDAFIIKCFYCCNLKIKFNMKDVNFQ